MRDPVGQELSGEKILSVGGREVVGAVVSALGFAFVAVGFPFHMLGLSRLRLARMQVRQGSL